MDTGEERLTEVVIGEQRCRPHCTVMYLDLNDSFIGSATTNRRASDAHDQQVEGCSNALDSG